MLQILPEFAKNRRPGRNVRLPEGYPTGPPQFAFSRFRRPIPRLPYRERTQLRVTAASRPRGRDPTGDLAEELGVLLLAHLREVLERSPGRLECGSTLARGLLERRRLRFVEL